MKIVLLFVLLVFGVETIAQNTIVERKQTTENGITKGWTITKELDDNGNVINYDSTYFQRDSSQDNEVMDFNFDGFGDSHMQFFNFGTDSLDISSLFQQFGLTDSLFQPQFFNFDELLEQYKQQMEQLYTPTQIEPSDTTQFKYPENGKVKKI
ncbi:hypothetical protein K6119_06870 [Paracrocinitomix mangrovi]|uniref:hypothetical protein n=1 Tax=Paracrocinitomix mangrovi TaxID=2862509 RepID=UPI001C8DE03C|nr:hypothetical protein [Paracrocinitomix mangrovi]UKN03235.1 hypothetical protein K6119_06870 [Paracrocinitomix mangrovi]